MSETRLKSIPEPTRVDGDTPALRLFSLLEVIARKDQFFSLQSLVEETGLPKPTLHRMLQQLESAGMLQRDADGRFYGPGLRLRRLAEDLLLNNTVHGARHAVLRTLVEEVGESCNITALSGSEVLYLDRVETQAPLRFYLHPGSRVPAHCSASGKLFLSQMPRARRRRILASLSFKRYTDNTITDIATIEAQLEHIARTRVGVNNEELQAGVIGIAVPVTDARGRMIASVALQAPVAVSYTHLTLPTNREV